MEILDVVDETGAPTGETVERAEAHREGVRHRTAPVRNKSDPTPALSHLILLSTPELLKECNHPLPVYVRHWKYHSSPEMNLSAYISSVIKAESVRSCCGQSRHVRCDAAHPPGVPLRVLRFHRLVHKDVDSEFHRQPFHDHQISNVYLLWLDREAEEFELQTEEIESVRWMDYAQVRGMVASDTLPNCIIMEELDLIERHFL